MGKEAIRLLRFAMRYPRGWHSFSNDRKTVNAVKRLVELDLLVLTETPQFKRKQFRLALGKDYQDKLDGMFQDIVA